MDLWCADAAPLERVEPLRSTLAAALVEAGATVLHTHFHQFEPHGFTGVFIISQSHLTAHSWVEERLLAVDLFSCGDLRWPVVLEALRSVLRPIREQVRHAERG